MPAKARKKPVGKSAKKAATAKTPTKPPKKTVAAGRKKVASGTARIARAKPKEPAPQAAAPAPEVVTAAGKTAAQQITAEDLRNQITKFSADEFEGRAPATPGDSPGACWASNW